MNILSVCLLASAVAFTSAAESFHHLAPIDVKRANTTTLATGQLYVGGVDLLSQPDYKVAGTTGYAQLSGNTLTLNNFTYNGAGHTYTYTNETNTSTYRGGIMYFGTEDLEINVEGENTIKVDNSNKTFRTYGIGFWPGKSFSEFLTKNLTFTGNGSLDLTSGIGEVSMGIGANTKGGKVIFDGPDVNVAGADDPSTSGSSYGLNEDYSKTSVTTVIKTGNISFIGGKTGTSVGIGCNVTQEGGNLIAKSTVDTGNPWRPYGIWTGFGDMIFNGGTANISSVMKYGINSGNLKVGPNMKGITITGGKGAVYSLDNYSSKIEVDSLAWTDIEGTGDPTYIQANSHPSTYNNTYKKLKIGGFIKATATGYDGDYDGQAHSISVTTTTPSTGATIKYGTSADACTLDTPPEYTDAGTYTTYYQITADGYDTFTGSANVTIKKVDSVYSAPTAVSDLVYTGEPKALVHGGVSNHGTFSYKLSNQDSYYATIPEMTNPGTYTVNWKLDGDANHTDAQSDIEVTIDKADLSNVAVKVTSDDFLCDGTIKKPTLSTTGKTVTNSDPVFTYSDTIDGTYSEEIPGFTTAGTHTIYWKASAEYHNDVTGSVTFNINPAVYSITPSVTLTTPSVDYDGTAKTPVVETNGATPNDAEITFSYATKKDGEYASMPSFTEAGKHMVYWKASATNYETITGEFEFTINKIASAYENEPAAITGLSYTGENQDLVTRGSTADGVVKYSLSESGPFTTEIPQGKAVGEYTIFYKIEGDNNHNDSMIKSVKTVIAANAKTGLIDSIKKAEDLYNNIKDNYPQVADTLKDAIDEATRVRDDDNVTNKEIADATDLLEKAYQKAELDSRDIIKDEETGVQVKTNDGTGIPTDVNLKVELKANIKAEEASVEYSKIQEKVGNDYQISNVFEIKLIKTENGVEREIQPSEIKEGMKLIITMDLPEGLNTKGLKLLHIHNNGESEYVDEFTIENGKVTFEVSSLSEIALVTPKNNLNVITILIIVIASILLLLTGIWLLMMFATNQWIKDDKDKARRACKFFGIKNKKDEFVVLSFPFKFVGRNEDEIFDNKEDAEK